MLLVTETTEQHRTLSIEADVLDLGPAGRHGRLVLSGVVHAESVAELESAVEEMLLVDPSDLVIDVSDADVQTAGGMRVISRLRSTLQRRGATVVVDGLRGATARVLEATEAFDRYLRTRPTAGTVTAA
jgi:anti-anti-sigma regulatory factor